MTIVHLVSKEHAAKVAKSLTKNQRKKAGNSKKIGRNRVKCAQYRARVGKPAGRGMDGQHKH